MADSGNPLAPNPVTNVDSPEVERHILPIENIEEPDEEPEEEDLLLDEADTLFGKRSGVKGSHDCYPS